MAVKIASAMADFTPEDSQFIKADGLYLKWPFWVSEITEDAPKPPFPAQWRFTVHLPNERTYFLTLGKNAWRDALVTALGGPGMLPEPTDWLAVWKKDPTNPMGAWLLGDLEQCPEAQRPSFDGPAQEPDDVFGGRAGVLDHYDTAGNPLDADEHPATHDRDGVPLTPPAKAPAKPAGGQSLHRGQPGPKVAPIAAPARPAGR